MLLAIALVSAATTTASAQPSGWKAYYNDGNCIVANTLPPSGDAIEIKTISWDIVYNYFKITIAAPGSTANFKVEAEPIYETVDGLVAVPKASFVSEKRPNNRLLVEVTMSDSWAKTVSFAGLGLKTSEGDKRVSTDGLVEAKKILDFCRQQYLQKLGIDPAEVEYSFTRAKSSAKPGVWFSDDDLPKLKGKRTAFRPFMIWRIGADARTSRCQLVTSSGDPELDAVLCPTFMKRMRYDAPAFDQQGNAIASWQGRRIVINY